jgi:hypothetical protein
MAGNPFAASTSSSSSAPRENEYYLGEEEEEEEEPTYWQRLVRPNKNILFLIKKTRAFLVDFRRVKSTAEI